MKSALEVVNLFYEATNIKRDVKATADLVADDMAFVGPVVQTAGAREYLALLGDVLANACGDAYSETV